eukprot:4416467-Alexandrium_andersonii.AAC.1
MSPVTTRGGSLGLLCLLGIQAHAEQAEVRDACAGQLEVDGQAAPADGSDRRAGLVGDVDGLARGEELLSTQRLVPLLQARCAPRGPPAR